MCMRRVVNDNNNNNNSAVVRVVVFDVGFQLKNVLCMFAFIAVESVDDIWEMNRNKLAGWINARIFCYSSIHSYWFWHVYLIFCH